MEVGPSAEEFAVLESGSKEDDSENPAEEEVDIDVDARGGDGLGVVDEELVIAAVE